MSVDARCADPLLLGDINKAILEYLLYAATKALLWDFQHVRARCKADIPLELLDSFLIIFKHIHPTFPPDPGLQFRMRLFKFCALFTRRKRPSNPTMPPQDMQILRKRRQNQANKFRSDEEVGSDYVNLAEKLSSSERTMRIKQEIADAVPARPDAISGRSSKLPSISLLDTLPSFMALSATQNALPEESKITDIWMRLTAGFMAQAVAEQYLVYNSQQTDVIREAFAWGFDEENGAEEGSDDYLTNVMFWDEEAEGPNSAWEEIRDEHMRALIPPEGINLRDHLQNLLASKLSISDFEERIHAFLEGLHRSQKKPFLAQIESGRIDGLLHGETQALQEKSRLL